MLKTVVKFTLGLIISALGLLYALDLAYQTKPIPEVIYSSNKNTLVLKGLIANANPVFKLFSKEIADMPALSKQLLSMVKAGEKKIFIKINSPGGLLSEGHNFILLMKDVQSLGVKFTCIIDGSAMSMATIIFTECNERLAIVGSIIMWHSIAQVVNTRMNMYTAQAMADRFKELNKSYWHSTRLHFYPWFFNHHFKEESHLPVTQVQANSFMYLRVIREHVIQ